jgi:potassium-transporting ATPase potassium-binding subunit
MTVIGWVEIALFVAVVIALARPLGPYMAAVFDGRRTFLSPVLAPVERGFYALAGVNDPPDAQYLRVYVRQLRQKIEADPERPHILLTETGIGYRLRAPA